MRADDEPVERILHEALNQREKLNLRRRRIPVRVIDSVHVEIDGIRYTNFSSNNYLGLTHHPRVLAAIADANRRAGAGSAASPLITGYSEDHAAAERAIATWKGTESSVL